MIVVLIMGVVYNLALTNFQQLKSSKEKLTLANLKEYLGALKYKTNAQILCLDDCSTCKILVDGNETEEVKNLFDDSIKMYRYDALNGMILQDPTPYFNKEDVEEDVCFSYKVYAEGVGDQVFLEYKEKYYDLTDYFSGTIIGDSMEALVQKHEDMKSEVMQ